ncbi:DUF4175 family protein [Persicimonas caeni]|uniref:DUF4175 family protein n=1 Tax=Persicimonas caeni TaxID=2292766 RepID=A0A4Y6PR99_PERCE|nr:DUF4175 family protein [Persicimonas caeni]QDG50864.1 DUF4175 family protein [Persicimonas caeni]QED32085.1 DUF4175 family protein [Persicimonas caeni]
MADHSEQLPDNASLEKDLGALRAILHRTGRAWRRPIVFEGALWYLVTLGAVVLSALLLGALVPQFIPGVTKWVLVVGGVAATLGAIVAWLGLQAGKGDVEGVATLLQRHHPAFRNDLVAALEFAEKLLDGDDNFEFSTTMARAHVRRTVSKVLSKAEHGHLAHLLPRRELVAPAMSLAGCLTLLIVPLLVDADWTLKVLNSPFAKTAAEKAEDPDIRPIVGDLYIYYSTPPYTGLGRKMDAFSTGHIETMVGTEVAIEAYPLIPNTKQIELVLETGEGTNKIVMEKLEKGPHGKLRGSFVALEPGTYHFRATLDDGTVVEDGAERKIELLPDNAPKVTVTSHEGELEVSPDDVLEIEFEVSDDFGLESVARVWHFAGGQENASKKKLDLPELANSPKETSGKIRFDLTPLSLQPKDVVVFYIEAVDNNTLTGPGTGQSQPIRLRVSSPEDKHLQNIADQQKILEELLGLLATYLESPMGEREVRSDDTWHQVVPVSTASGELTKRVGRLAKLQTEQKRILDQMGELVDKLEEDPLMLERDFTLFSALHKQLVELHDDGQSTMTMASTAMQNGGLSTGRAQRVADYASRAEDTLEKGILRFEELLASQKMEAIKATAEDIKELKDRLKELLKKYKETKDPELKKAILREIQRMRQRMSELMQRMQMQLQKLPQEHMNLDAIKQQQLESDSRKMADSLQQIEKMLENDDIDGALKALENMEMNLDSLTQDMNEQFGQAQPQGLSELDKKVGELMDQVNDLQAAEKKLEEDTAQLNKELAKERQEQIDEMLDEFTKELRQKVERQKQALEKMEGEGTEQTHRDGIKRVEQKLDELDKMLEEKDIEQSLEKAREAQEASRRLRFRIDLSQRYSDSPEQKEQLGELRKMNDGVEERGQRIVDDLEEMMDQAQQKLGNMNQQRMQELSERQKKISEQAKKLEQKIGEASKRFPMLEQQLKPSMQKSQEAMQDAQESLGKRRIQRGLDSERSALEQLGKLKQQMKQAVQKQKRQQQGQQSTRDEKVKIPGQDDQRAGKELRQDVMDAMKEEKLDSYESEIEQYYKSIME